MGIRRPHWNARYLANRVRDRAQRRLRGDQPWLAPHAVETLRQWLRHDDLVVEFGAGASTRWFAQRVGQLVSIETDQGWFERVQEQVRDMGNVNLVLADRSDAASYLAAIPSIALGTISCGLVDGKFRDHAALWLVPRIAPGGLLVIDDVHRYLPSESRSPHSRNASQGPATPEWEEFRQTTLSWRRLWLSTGVSDTAIFIANA